MDTERTFPLNSDRDGLRPSCDWNMLANYEDGKFESCKGDNDLPMGIYDGKTWVVPPHVPNNSSPFLTLHIHCRH
ncbi:hypothetical protein FIBSPDRAFT_871739 [Athelia psychrophila]|uniref:Uncharacterized protein n=1 Tax=Athelia psychrophila TaxID=1759441 RepID=A0A166A434_9AGAM|nr:hypothetical protein FIBSPDRAFT_871739 [Fibularhizoctonia sp. CBS 109695]